MTTYSWGDVGDRDPRLGNIPATPAAPASMPVPAAPMVQPGPVLPPNAVSMCLTQLLLAAAVCRMAQSQMRYETDRRTADEAGSYALRIVDEVLLNCATYSVRVELQLENVSLKPGVGGQKRLLLVRELLAGALSDADLTDTTGRVVLEPLTRRTGVLDAVGAEIAELCEDESIWRLD